MSAAGAHIVDRDEFQAGRTALTPVALGTVDVAAGQHRLRLDVIGRNPASSGHYFGIDCLELAASPAGHQGGRP